MCQLYDTLDLLIAGASGCLGLEKALGGPSRLSISLMFLDNYSGVQISQLMPFGSLDAEDVLLSFRAVQQHGGLGTCLCPPWCRVPGSRLLAEPLKTVLSVE